MTQGKKNSLACFSGDEISICINASLETVRMTWPAPLSYTAGILSISKLEVKEPRLGGVKEVGEKIRRSRCKGRVKEGEGAKEREGRVRGG